MAKLRFRLEAIRHNAKIIMRHARERGIDIAFVNKVSCGLPALAEAVMPLGFSQIADSRVENLAGYGKKYQRLLLRPMENAEESVRFSDISLESEITSLKKLDLEAERQGKRHKVILMIDLGDLREGVFFKNREEIFAFAREAKRLSNIELAGIGTNLTCFGGVLPSDENLGVLSGLARDLRLDTGLALPIVSGGNSSSLPLLLEGRLPGGITHLRIGESLLLGTNTQNGEPLKGFGQDTVALYANLIELKEKPSLPIGETGLNAFGERVQFEDKGTMLRGILALGRQDVSIEDLTPLDDRVKILGASSDHLLVDLSLVPKSRLSDSLGFSLNYSGVLRLSTSKYVKKESEIIENVSIF